MVLVLNCYAVKARENRMQELFRGLQPGFGESVDLDFITSVRLLHVVALSLPSHSQGPLPVPK